VSRGRLDAVDTEWCVVSAIGWRAGAWRRWRGGLVGDRGDQPLGETGRELTGESGTSGFSAGVEMGAIKCWWCPSSLIGVVDGIFRGFEQTAQVAS
jgi:hypothetical protein